MLQGPTSAHLQIMKRIETVVSMYNFASDLLVSHRRDWHVALTHSLMVHASIIQHIQRQIQQQYLGEAHCQFTLCADLKILSKKFDDWNSNDSPSNTFNRQVGGNGQSTASQFKVSSLALYWPTFSKETKFMRVSALYIHVHLRNKSISSGELPWSKALTIGHVADKNKPHRQKPIFGISIGRS